MVSSEGAGGRWGARECREIDAHPGPLELIALVRGSLERAREGPALRHCVACRRCAAVISALAAVRRGRGLAVRPGLERPGGATSIH